MIMKDFPIENAFPSGEKMWPSTTKDQEAMYNAYRWTKIIQLYLNRHVLLKDELAYQGFDILLALDAAHFMGQKLSITDLCEMLKGPRKAFMNAIQNLEKMNFIKRSMDAHDQVERIDLTLKGLKVMQIGYRKLFSTLDLSANA
jgi:DNA-binding MarR family transcriptional regulator